VDEIVQIMDNIIKLSISKLLFLFVFGLF